MTTNEQNILRELHEKVWDMQPDMLAHHLGISIGAAVRMHTLIKKELVNKGIMTPGNILIRRKGAK